MDLTYIMNCSVRSSHHRSCNEMLYKWRMQASSKQSRTKLSEISGIVDPQSHAEHIFDRIRPLACRVAGGEQST